MANKNERKPDIPCKSMPSLYDCDGESSLNPFALEFIPSHLQPGVNDETKQCHCQKSSCKTESTSTTTLVQHEVVGDASYLNAQSQLFELLHQLGDKFMPLKAVKMSLAPDGQGVNVHFKADQRLSDILMLDENLCQDAALHLELSDRSFMSHRLPNVLAANFMVRMGDVLKDKMDWNEELLYPNRSTVDIKSNSNHLLERKRIMANHSSSVGKDIHKVDQIRFSVPSKSVVGKKESNDLSGMRIKHQRVTLPRPTVVSKIQGTVNAWTGSSKVKSCQKSVDSKPDVQSESGKKPMKGTITPRQSAGQGIKKGLTQKLTPRSTHTSQMRQTAVRKRLSQLKSDNQ